MICAGWEAPVTTAQSSKTCPQCGKDVPYFNDHCFLCGYDYDHAEPADDPLKSVVATEPATIVRSKAQLRRSLLLA